ncbi:MAG TPA: glutathione S-transferase family protein [Caulobacteraceae bacterium]|nr:glutathione S-transferase family protein [Caulobacteraceae bacterium]
MAEIVIHGVPGSPYVRKALLVCEEKGAPYRLRVMQLGEGKGPEYLKLQPFGRIPAVEHDGFALYETQAVMRYVDEAFEGPALQPKDPKARARMNQVMGIVDSYVMPSMSAGIGWNRIMAPRFGLPVDEAAVARAIPASRTCVRALEAILGDQPFMAGEALSLADLMLLPHLDLFPASPEGAEIIAGSPLLAWLERMRQRPSVQATDTDRLMGAAAA